MSDLHRIQVRRVYDDPAPGDGTRVLVDRIWPRGLTKEKASLEEWCQQIAPSTALRKWYGHDPERFAEFTRRYHRELTEPERAQARRSGQYEQRELVLHSGGLPPGAGPGDARADGSYWRIRVPAAPVAGEASCC
jgi:uncharacterized protein YeaO (DUF488 family)